MQTSQNLTQAEVREPKQKKRKARRDLLALLKRLRKLCGKLDSAEHWLDFAKKHVFPLLEEYKDVLPPANLQKMRQAALLEEPTKAAANQACKVLQTEIRQVTPYLPGTPAPLIAAQVAAGLIVAAALVAGAAVFVLSAWGPRVAVSNISCGTIPIVVPGALKDIPGIILPDEIPEDGQPHLVSLVPGSIDVDTSLTQRLTIRMFGVPLVPGLPVENLESIRFVDQGSPRELFGRNETISLRLGSEYALILTCR